MCLRTLQQFALQVRTRWKHVAVLDGESFSMAGAHILSGAKPYQRNYCVKVASRGAVFAAMRQSLYEILLDPIGHHGQPLADLGTGVAIAVVPHDRRSGFWRQLPHPLE